MKYVKFYRINIFIILLALSAGAFFTCGFSGRLPKNVTINGVEVGGKSRTQAVRSVRENIESALKEKKLTVYGKDREYVFTYPEIGYKDNLQALIKTVKNSGEYTAQVGYYLNGIGEITSYICDGESAPVTEPYAIFNQSGAPFDYFEGSDGVKADRLKLLNDIRASLESNFAPVTVSTTSIKRNTALTDVKRDTRLLSTFTTYFDGTNENRAHNIRLAAQKINGTVLQNGQTFSFNSAVGERTEARGFKSAKIIEKGEFVEGIGGGVCQVSTTLFNAAILSGCRIIEYHPHSLPVSYVPPSCDAMVSGTHFDLKLENVTGRTLYVRALSGENYVKFNIYGRGDGATYSYSSAVTGSIPAPVEETDDINSVREGKEGVTSEGYLTVTRNGIRKKVLFRKDKYSPVKKTVLSGNAEATLPPQ